MCCSICSMSILVTDEHHPCSPSSLVNGGCMQAAIMDTDSTRRELQQLRTTYLDTNQKMEELAKVCFLMAAGPQQSPGQLQSKPM